MTTRWWAPEKLGRDLDETVVAMLTPGTDLEKDVGLYLLAAHRAGAAAMQHVAKAEIASETGIALALADVRSQLAPRMVDALAPVTGGTYAGLFVRDVLDAADQGAIDLYRAALSKGVAAPVALERAAAGYGMPMKAMGQFASLAADPKATPRIVEDAADRALMTYVSKMAKAEVGEEVAKAEPHHPRESRTAVRDTDFDPREHPRGPDGRFVEAPDQPRELSTIDRIRQRLGLLSNEPARVAETVREAPPTAAPTARTARTAQTARTAAPVARSPIKTGVQRSIKAKPTRRKITSRQRRHMQQLATRLNHGQIESQAPAPRGKAEISTLPDLLHRLPDSRTDYYDIGQSMVIGVSQYQGAAIRTQASDQAMTQHDPSRRIFRLGHLLDRANYSEMAGSNAVHAHEQSAEIEHANHPDDYLQPQVEQIDHDELTGDPREDMPYVESRRRAMVTTQREMPNGDVRDVVDYDELNHVKALPIWEPYHHEEYDDYGRPVHDHGAMALVHYLPHDMSKPNNRPIPTVEEYVIDTDARGVEEGTGRHVDVHLDPNQIYEVVNAPDVRPGARVAPEQYYDVDNEVVVNRWFLRPVHESDIGDIISGVDKALSGSEKTRFEQLHPRDEDGQFAPTTERRSLVAPTALPTARTARSAQTAQTARTATTAARPAARASTPRMIRAVTRRPGIKARPATRPVHPISRALGIRLQERQKLRDMAVLSDVRAYKVLPEADFQKMLGLLDQTDFDTLHSGIPLRLDPITRQMFATTPDVRVDRISTSLGMNTADEVDRQGIPREVVDIIKVGARPDFEHIAERIETVLDKYPETDLVEVAINGRGDQILVYASKVPGNFQNVVEYDFDLNFDEPLELSYLGASRARDVMTERENIQTSLIGDLSTINEEHEGVVPNPVIHRYRLASPQVRRWRVDNA